MTTINNDYLDLSPGIRQSILEAAYKAGNNGAHLGPSLSLVEILMVLFTEVINYELGDKFILSKGHGALGYYATMLKTGLISQEVFDSFEVNGSSLPGQPTKNANLHIDYSSGSLGLGLSYGAGIALGDPRKKVYVLMGDGELNEGSVWESAMFAKHYKLSNLVAIIDNNRMQSDGEISTILDMDIPKVWESFGWHVVLCDGHDTDSLSAAFRTPVENKPKVIIARTVKGKGVSFMENSKSWHHNRLTAELYQDAMDDLIKG